MKLFSRRFFSQDYSFNEHPVLAKIKKYNSLEQLRTTLEERRGSPLTRGGVYEICVNKGDVKNREFEFDILTRKPALPTMNYHYKIQPNIKQQVLSEFYRFLNE